MKLVPPLLVSLAALTSVGAAANDKKRTAFHNNKVNDIDGDDHARERSDARRARRKRPTGTMNKMERATKVNINRIVEQGLARHAALKKQQKATSRSDAFAREATSGERVNREAESSTTAETKPATHANVRRTVGAEGTPAPAAAPVAAPDDVRRTEEGGAEKERRRRDRALDEGSDAERKATEDAAAAASITADQRTGRGGRTGPVPAEKREPNPRPRRRKISASGKAPGKRESGKKLREDRADVNNQRDLKKSKKYSNSSKSKSGKSENEDRCVVRLTNLTKHQWFSDVFWMVHFDKLSEPLWSYGDAAFDDLATLAQDGDPSELLDFFEDDDNVDGVLDLDSARGPLMESDQLLFYIPRSGSYDRFTMASSFLFSNDGFVGIDAGEIRDGATWYLWGIDAGVEANTQLCWTVPATSADFPPNSECSTVRENIADENDNQFVGEGFVHVHAGIHDFESRNDLNDFLAFTCDDLGADSFVDYFFELEYDDDNLLFDDDRARNERDDESFLDFVEDNDDLLELPIFNVAVDAGSFRQFCRDLEDIDDFLINTFRFLEPQVFDFRTPMMRVEINC